MGFYYDTGRKSRPKETTVNRVRDRAVQLSADVCQGLLRIVACICNYGVPQRCHVQTSESWSYCAALCPPSSTWEGRVGNYSRLLGLLSFGGACWQGNGGSMIQGTTRPFSLVQPELTALGLALLVSEVPEVRELFMMLRK